MHGKGTGKYDNIRIGINSRLDTIQAAILLVKLRIFQEYELEAVNQIADWYNVRLKDSVAIPYIPDGYYSSFAQYTIRCESMEQRDDKMEKLRKNKIPSKIYYPKPLHAQTAFQVIKTNETDVAVANELCRTVLSLPMHPYLTVAEVEHICNCIAE